jgi:hypothetical protein
MTNPTPEAQAQWDAACKTLSEEFQLSVNDLPAIDTSKALFFQLLGRRQLTQEAANALMYSVYFVGYLSTLSACKQLSPDFEVPEYLHIHPVLESSNRWAQQATDGHLLLQLAQPVIHDTQILLDALN